MRNIINAVVKLVALQMDTLRQLWEGQITLAHLEWFNDLSKGQRDRCLQDDGSVTKLRDALGEARGTCQRTHTHEYVVKDWFDLHSALCRLTDDIWGEKSPYDGEKLVQKILTEAGWGVFRVDCADIGGLVDECIGTTQKVLSRTDLNYRERGRLKRCRAELEALKDNIRSLI